MNKLIVTFYCMFQEEDKFDNILCYFYLTFLTCQKGIINNDKKSDIIIYFIKILVNYDYDI